MIALAALLLAGIDPPRPTDLWVESKQPLVDLQACMTRAAMRAGRITPVPTGDGVELDFQLNAGFVPPGKPIMTFTINDAGEARRITVAYRHPFSKKTAFGMFQDLGKKCFPEEWASTALQMP